MGLAKSRTITLVVALATLTSNILSSLLFSQLPDDPFHLASNFRWYLHFANVLSVFGFVGSLRQHALSIAVFSNYLILDTILCAIPRFLVLGLLQNLSHTLCSSPPSSPFSPPPDTQSHIPSSPTELHAYSPNSPASQWERVTGSWTPDGCYRIVYLTQMALAAGVIAGTLLQFVDALCVREYARALWVRDLRDEALLTRSAERGEAPLSEKQAQIKN